MDDARLGRLEVKLDRLAEAMTKLVAHEAVMENLINHNSTQDSRLNKHSLEIDEHSIKLAVVARSSGANEWFVRLLIAALVTGAAFMLRT